MKSNIGKSLKLNSKATDDLVAKTVLVLAATTAVSPMSVFQDAQF